MQSARLESVAGLVQKYFEWVGVFEKGLDPPLTLIFLELIHTTVDTQSEQDDVDHVRRKRLRVYQTTDIDGGAHGSTREWIEYDCPERGNDERRGTMFSWT